LPFSFPPRSALDSGPELSYFITSEPTEWYAGGSL